MPVLCEDKSIPYIYVTSKEILGASSETKRATSVILVQTDSDYVTDLTSVMQDVTKLNNELLGK